jgi:hypothetical protein
VQRTVYSAVCIVYSAVLLFTVHSVLFIVHSVLFIVQCLHYSGSVDKTYELGFSSSINDGQSKILIY